MLNVFNLKVSVFCLLISSNSFFKASISSKVSFSAILILFFFKRSSNCLLIANSLMIFAYSSTFSIGVVASISKNSVSLKFFDFSNSSFKINSSKNSCSFRSSDIFDKLFGEMDYKNLLKLKYLKLL
jgi:hypothetical protein